MIHPPRSAKRTSAGFTLVELLVTLAVMGMLAGIGVVLVRSAAQQIARSEAADKKMAEVAAVQTALRRMIGHAVYAGNLPGLPARADILQLEAPLPMALAGGQRGAIKLAVAGQENGNDLVMEWRAHSAPGTQAEWRRATLLGGIKDARFFYYGKNGNVLQKAWSPEWTHTQPPELIKLDIIFAEKDIRQWPEFVVAPIINADVSCVYNPSTRACWEK